MKKLVKKNKIQIDAAGQAAGRVATQVAMILMGKNKAAYETYLDQGDYVTVINAKQVKFTGKKLVQKDLRHHSMYPGGLKLVSIKKVLEIDPGKIIRHAVMGMLPKNKMRTARMKRLTVKA